MKTVYRMSEAGECIKALVARKLGYEPIPESPDSLEALEHYSRCEDIAAWQMTDKGHVLQHEAVCPICRERTGEFRNGIHVELSEALFDQVGHLDRRIYIDEETFPVEIKSLGRFTWPKFQKEQFDDFMGYAAQEACYLKAEGKPGIYWVMNRDTGRSLKYIVNDFENRINLPGFERVTLPITYEQIVEKLNSVEIYAQENELPEVEYEEDKCRYCRFRYLCADMKEEEVSQELNAPGLLEAAKLYREGNDQRKQGEDKVDFAKDILIKYAKSSEISKYRVGGVSVSYRGQKTKEYLDSALLKVENSELYQRYLKQSRPYEDVSIRVLKGD